MNVLVSKELYSTNQPSFCLDYFYIVKRLSLSRGGVRVVVSGGQAQQRGVGGGELKC